MKYFTLLPNKSTSNQKIINPIRHKNDKATITVRFSIFVDIFLYQQINVLHNDDDKILSHCIPTIRSFSQLRIFTNV